MDTFDEILTRGVENIIPQRSTLSKLLSSGQKLNVYLGIDPTATEIHLGHTVPLRKLQKFAQLGHRVTFLIGDFTALIGDTSDKDSERPVLTSKQIEHNFQTYKSQAEKILDFSKINVVYNSQWLSKLNFVDIVKLAQNFSAGDFYSRELIRKRLNEGKYVGLHEILYPVMQGYDSYVMDTDIQLGGTDQTFNMQAGRILQRKLRNKESYIIANGFLTGIDGRKMSKTWQNAIWLRDSADEIYGKVMSIKDDLIIQYFTLATNISLDTLTGISQRLAESENPIIIKKELAHRIVSELHSPEEADTAQADFETRFQKGTIDMTVSVPVVKLAAVLKHLTVIEVLMESKLAASSSQAKRLISQQALRHNGVTITDTKRKLDLKPGDIIEVGRKAVRIIE